MAGMMLSPVRGRDGCDHVSLQADQGRRRRRVESDVLAGRDTHQSAFAVGTKDQEASRIFYEPLAGWDRDGDLVPILAAGSRARRTAGWPPTARSVTWKLKRGVKWHDGKPFTADDVVFNWECAESRDPAVSIGSYKDVDAEKVDD